MNDLPWYVLPTAMCLVITGIHGYLGIHVLERKVIFVDLAMAQIAALGATYALFLGYDAEHEPMTVYIFSLGFTLVGAAVFALTRMRHDKVPQEAIIGIVYASATAIAILILAKSPTADEHIKHMLVGNILLVDWTAVRDTAGIYAAIGVLHFVFRDRFLDVTHKPESARNVKLWDFLFYLSFGVVITRSVAVAGVLLVFSFLVVPATISALFAERIGRRLWIAWGVGTLVSILGMALSYFGDLPTGPSVVACFAGTLVVAGLVYAVKAGVGVKRLALGTAVVAAAFWGTTLLRKGEPEHGHATEFERLVEDLQSDDDTRVLHAIDHLAQTRDPHAVELLVELLGRAPSDRVIQHAAEALGSLGDPAALPALHQQARLNFDADVEITIAEAILRLKDPGGLALMVEIIQNDREPPFPRERAAKAFQEWTGREFEAEWWQRRAGSLRWRQSKRRYE